MIYRGHGFLCVGFNSSPISSPVSKLDGQHTETLRKRNNLLTGEGGNGFGEEPKSYDGEKAWSSVNHSILSGPDPDTTPIIIRLSGLRAAFKGSPSAGSFKKRSVGNTMK